MQSEHKQKPIFVELPQNVHHELKKLAACQRTTMSAIIRELVKAEIVRHLGERALREVS